MLSAIQANSCKPVFFKKAKKKTIWKSKKTCKKKRLKKKSDWKKNKKMRFEKAKKTINK